MKIYIAGKITGDPDYKAKFGKAASELRAAGHTPINPARLPEGMSKGDYMRINFAQMDSADAIMFLPDWQDSDGAQLEHAWAVYVAKEIYDATTERLFDGLTRGEVMDGLSMCANPQLDVDCTRCPLYSVDDCSTKIMRSAYALLQHQDLLLGPAAGGDLDD